MRVGCLLAILLLFALPGVVGAQTPSFHIPFSFVAFDSEFPAGDYRLSNSSALMVKIAPIDPGMADAKYMTIWPKGQVKLEGKAYLMFEKVGDFYLLREYCSGVSATAMSTPLSKEWKSWERTYIAKNVRGEFVLIAAR